VASLLQSCSSERYGEDSGTITPIGLVWKIAKMPTAAPPRSRSVSTWSPLTTPNSTLPLATICATGVPAAPEMISHSRPSFAKRPSCCAAKMPPNSGSGTQLSCSRTFLGAGACAAGACSAPAPRASAEAARSAASARRRVAVPVMQEG
jgi:hypothetical protein